MVFSGAFLQGHILPQIGRIEAACSEVIIEVSLITLYINVYYCCVLGIAGIC